MNSNVGVNVHKELNSLMKRIKMPNISKRKYYTYNYDGEPSYKYWEEKIEDSIKDPDCKDSCILDIEINKKTVAIIGAGIAVGILGICILKRKH